MGDSLFAAYDPIDRKNDKYLIVASSDFDYLFTSRSLFWPDSSQTGLGTSSRHGDKRAENCHNGYKNISKSRLQWSPTETRGLLTRLTNGSLSSKEDMGEVMMILLSAMTELETSVQQRFTKKVVKIDLSYHQDMLLCQNHCRLLYTMVNTLAEGRFNVLIPGLNRTIDPNTFYPLRSEFLAVWEDISNATQGFKEQDTTHVALDEVLRLELSNFASLLKMRPGVNDDHVLVQLVIDLWFMQVDYEKDWSGGI